MLARCSKSRLLTPSARVKLFQIQRLRLPHHRRRYTASHSAQVQPIKAPASSLAYLATVTDELDHLAPRFAIDAKDIEIIRGPKEFYDELKAKISKAKHRIYLSTLYIGKTEHELISTIQQALRNNPDLKVSFLADALRGTREQPEATCASLLAPLITEFGAERVQVRLFHTPNLTGWRKKLIPIRINEGWGLQHMKLYGFDNEIIFANLSRDYFTNRQDRYYAFRSQALTDYFSRIHNAVCSMSFDVQPDINTAGFSMSWPKDSAGPSPLDDPKGYIRHASSTLDPLINPSASQSQSQSRTSTAVYPIFQFTPLLVTTSSTELPALTHLLSTLTHSPFAQTTLTFTAGYFNPSSTLTNLLLSTNPAKLTIISAARQANGFYGSRGISGMLPAGYTFLCARFLKTAYKDAALRQRVKMLEWRRGTVGEPDGWTYHAKGIWVTLPKDSHEPKADGQRGDAEQGPSITVVGSSNYTQRSYTLDIESNAMVVTRDPGLQRRMREEEMWLQEYAGEVTLDDFASTERRVRWHVRLAMWIVTAVGGAM